MTTLFRKSILGLFVAAMILPSVALVNAQSSDTTSVGALISPPSFEIKANPGESRKNTIRLTNKSSSTITYQATAEDFTVTGQEGQVAVQDQSTDGSFSHWFSITPAEFTLQPNNAQYVDFTITVPSNAEPGGHFASILFQPKVVAKNDTSGASVVQRLGALILLTVSGQTKEQATIESFHSKTFSGSWDDVMGSDGKTIIHIAKDEKLALEHSTRYFSHGPMALDLLVKNEGNVHVKPVGTVTIRNVFGVKVDEIALDPANVFPGAERRITIIWPRKNLWGGYYKAQVIAVYGSNNQTLTSTTWFWVFPTWALINIIVVLALALVFRKRLVKVLKVLIRG